MLTSGFLFTVLRGAVLQGGLTGLRVQTLRDYA